MAVPYTYKDKALTDAQIKALEELETNEMAELFNLIAEQSHVYAGAGSMNYQYTKNYSRIDRFGISYMTPNSEHSGVTFITRPKLCLSSSNLRGSRLLNTLDTTDPYSTQFMVRWLLDTRSAKTPEWIIAANQSPLIDTRSPFITPLTNNLLDIDGFPSQSLEVYTTEADFFSADQSFVIGSDENKRSFDLSLNFLEPQGAPLSYLFSMWLTYMSYLCTGDVMQYPEDIQAQRMGYTVSIYRFALDTTKKYITRFSKCTGCFPVNLPIGASFAVSRGERFIEAAKTINVTFKCNHFMANDPLIIQNFNQLVLKYWPDLKYKVHPSLVNSSQHYGYAATQTIKKAPVSAESNYMGIPYILTDTNLRNPPELAFFYTDEEDNQLATNYEAISKAKDELLAKRNSILASSTPEIRENDPYSQL